MFQALSKFNILNLFSFNFHLVESTNALIKDDFLLKLLNLNPFSYMQISLTETSPTSRLSTFNNFKEGMNFNPFLLSQLKFFHYTENIYL